MLSFYQIILYSFEIKISIDFTNLREYFFQTVSNSSWAHESYLVGANIDWDDDEFYFEVTSLCSQFGIGLIELNVEDPDLSRILIEAEKKNKFDLDNINKILPINQNFKDYIQLVKQYSQAEHMNLIAEKPFDPIKEKTELIESLQENGDQVF